VNATLELRGVSRHFGAETAADDVSLAVAPGEFVSILGPSGSGKSTILRLVAGLETPDHGTIALHGVGVTRMPPHRRDCALVFQHYALFPHRTVRENVGFGLAMRRLPASAISSRVEAMLHRVGLAGHGDKRPHQLSGGQQQRVALARALIVEPAVLLLDEPFGALDLSLRRQLQDELRQIHRESGQAVLHVTHDQGEALALSDRVVVLHRGRLVQAGPPEEIYERPANRFVAEFMDFRNFLPTEPLGLDGDTIRLRILGQDVALPRNEVAWPGPLVAAIRPEHITLALGGATPEPRWHATVSDVRYAGTSHVHTLTLDDGTSLEAHALVEIPVGTGVTARVEPRHIVVLGP
jgi:ABC-type Fe3+/spermidine/putrescine transport system ATPase subunit